MAEGTAEATRLEVLRAGTLSVPHGFSTRTGGVSDGAYASLNLGPKSGDALEQVRANRERFLAEAGLAGRVGIAPAQVHSNRVSVHRRGDGGGVVDGDGVVTDDPAAVLMVLAADCAAILLHDPRRQVIGAVHAGWRGTAGRIAAVAVERMAAEFGCDPADIRAAIGPAIGRCCYEVGPEVVEAVGATVHLSPGAWMDGLPAGKARIDLMAVNRAQLLAAGLTQTNVTALGRCTMCDPMRFYSYRRDGEPSGRNGAAIGLPV